MKNEYRAKRIIIAFMLICVVIVVLGLWFGCSSSALTRVHPTVKGQSSEIRDLHDRQAMFIRAWYWQLDERTFWSFITRHGPMDRNRHEDTFYTAFSKPLDLVNVGSRKLTEQGLISAFGYEQDVTDYVRLNEGNKNFALVRADLTTAFDNPDFHVRSAREALFWNTLPDVPYVVSVFGIEGDGYAPGVMTIIWVRQENRWMIWNLLRW